ncbi:MAG TPA: hypothetical protein VMV23_12340 [Candidatus Nanopelagicaceae bacterium]|nr:hypothetical protein [Candidatus Nanopelagicaceae bacterium]
MVRQLRWAKLGGGLLAVLLLSSCAGSGTSAAGAVQALVSGLPARQNAQPLQAGTDSCSPDGGFYVDNTKIAFYYARQVPLRDVLPLLPATEARDARSLSGLGPLLEVVALASNPGASTCGVGLTQTVLESAMTAKLDPAGLTSALQHTYYEPIRPILVLSNNRLDVCSANVNPGGYVWLIAVFPPVNPSVRVAVVNPAPQFGFYLPVARGALPSQPPRHLYAEDVNHCIQILSAG